MLSKMDLPPATETGARAGGESWRHSATQRRLEPAPSSAARAAACARSSTHRPSN